MRSNRSGQSVLEYVIVLTAIVAVMILAATNFIAPSVTQSMTGARDSMNSATARLPK